MPPKPRKPAVVKRSNAASKAIANIPQVPKDTSRPVFLPFPLTNRGKALKFQRQTEKAQKAVAREDKPGRQAKLLPPPGDMEDELLNEEQRLARKELTRRRLVHMRARGSNSATRSNLLLTTRQKRRFYTKQKAARAEKERTEAAKGQGGAKSVEVWDESPGVWIKDVPYPGYMEEAKANLRMGQPERNRDAIMPGPGVKKVLRSQGASFLPIRGEVHDHMD